MILCSAAGMDIIKYKQYAAYLGSQAEIPAGFLAGSNSLAAGLWI